MILHAIALISKCKIFSEELEKKIDSQLALCEFAMEKSTQVYRMNKQEQQNYEKLNKDIGKNCFVRIDEVFDCMEQ